MSGTADEADSQVNARSAGELASLEPLEHFGVRLKQLTGILTIESDDIDEAGKGTAVAKLNDELLTQEEFNRMVAMAAKFPVQDLGGRRRRPGVVEAAANAE